MYEKERAEMTLSIVFVIAFFVSLALATIFSWELSKCSNCLAQASKKLHFSEARAAALEQQTMMLGEQLTEFHEMKTQMDIIALWLRENCKRQIAMGLFNGRGTGEVVVGMLTGGFQLGDNVPEVFWCVNCSLTLVVKLGDTCQTCVRLLEFSKQGERKEDKQ